MLSAPSSRKDAHPGDQPTRAESGRIAIDGATRRLIESNAEPRWGKFLRAWEALAAARGAYPARTDVDPFQLGTALLPNIFLVDIVDGPRMNTRFRFRLLGQAIQDRETTRPGAYLDELGSVADIAEIERHYRATMAGDIRIRTASLVWNDARKDMFKYSVLMLPLADDGITVTHLVGLALYNF